MESLRLFSQLKFSWEVKHTIAAKDHKTLLNISGDNIQGTVEKFSVEPGLTFYCWHFNILRSHRSEFEFKTDSGNDRAYMMMYHFEQSEETMSFQMEARPAVHSRQKPFLFQYTNEHPLISNFSKPCQLNCLSISFSHAWLVRQLRSLKEEESTSEFLNQLSGAVYLRSLLKGEIILAKTLFNELNGKAFKMEVMAHFYNLATFLYRQVKIQAYKSSKTQYQIILSRVEKRIMGCLYTQLPPLNELAKEFYMSFSNLNRRFKDHYGTTIYDYYLEQKMLLAQQLLKENKLPVNVVATQLGYESVTHFIAMFKKIQGRSPGQLKKEKN